MTAQPITALDEFWDISPLPPQSDLPTLDDEGPVADKGPESIATRADLVATAITDWRNRLAASDAQSVTDGSDHPVTRATPRVIDGVETNADVVVDLTSAHPSGIAQLYAGRTTRLGNLIRDPAMQPMARHRTRALVEHVTERGARVGFAPVHLLVGVAKWTVPNAEDPTTTREMTVPVLLRPISISTIEGQEPEFEFTLESVTELHPKIAEALLTTATDVDHGGHSADGDGQENTRATSPKRFGFQPSHALDRIARLGRSTLTDFDLDHRVLVGSFVDPNQNLIADLGQLPAAVSEHDVLAALAGAADAVARLAEPPISAQSTVDPDPATERGIGDLDSSQRTVLETVARGRHLFVDAPLGADATSTAAAIVADAANHGRSVLYLSGTRRAAEALTSYLAGFDLDDLVLDVPPGPDWRHVVGHRLLTAMNSEAMRLNVEAHTKLRSDLLAARQQLNAYIVGLHQKRAPWQVSAYDALQALAFLSGQRPGPETSVRISPSATVALTAPVRATLAKDLARAARLGAFRKKVISTPWHGATLPGPEAVAEAVQRIERLVDDSLPRLTRVSAEIAEMAGLRPAATFSAFGEQLNMLTGIRQTLDVFRPTVFDQPLLELVQATAPRRWREEHGVQLSQVAKYRLRKQAEELLQPGARVPDLHAALCAAMAQQATWHSHAFEGGLPALMDGLTAVKGVYTATLADLKALQPVLFSAAAFADGPDLAATPLPELTEKLKDLLADVAALDALPERQAVLNRLTIAGLGPLLDDLAAREVPEALVDAELELLWWSSVFEQIVASDSALAGQTGASVDAMQRRFRAMDQTRIATLPAPIRSAVRSRSQAAMQADPKATEELYADLIESRFDTIRALRQRYDTMINALRPVVTATPHLIPAIFGPDQQVDLLVLDAAQQLPLEAVVGAIARAKQVVVIGDPRSATGTAIAELARVLPKVTLTARVSRRDPELTRLLARHGYADVVRPAPTARSEPLLHFEVADGVGAPDSETGAIASTQAEVDRAVELAIEHAMTRPEESLAVVALTYAHATRVRSALEAKVRENPAVAEFFSSRRVEPVVVTDAANLVGLSRDAVLLSVGFGRTPHGRVLHQFGPLAESSGQAQLLAALGVARKRLTVLSCLRPGELLPDRMRAAGPRLLLELLELAERRAAQPVEDLSEPVARAGRPAEVDRLLVDLAARLRREGYRAETNFGPVDGDKVALAVGHPMLPDEMLVAVVTDDAGYVREPSLRVRDRQWAERLEALGWTVTQVWSAVAFLDPEAEADRVARTVQRSLARRLGTSSPPLPKEFLGENSPPTELEVSAENPPLPESKQQPIAQQPSTQDHPQVQEQPSESDAAGPDADRDQPLAKAPDSALADA